MQSPLCSCLMRRFVEPVADANHLVEKRGVTMDDLDTTGTDGA